MRTRCPTRTSEGRTRKLNSFEVKLEEKLKASEFKLVVSLEKNSQLMKDLSKIKEELNHSLKWTDSSKILSNLANQKLNNKKGLGFRQIEPSYNPHSKYVSVYDILLCTHCGRNGHLKEKSESLKRVKERQDNFLVIRKRYVEKKKKRENNQCWYMDSGCSRHMTGDTQNFLFLEAHQGGGVSFGEGKKGFILVIDKIGRSTEHFIDNVHYVNGLKYNLLSVSQICDKGNEVKFLFDRCLVINCVTHKVVMSAKRIIGICERFIAKQACYEGPGSWTAKAEITFAKAIQLKVNCKIGSIRSDHGTEFENTQSEGFCAENGIHHNFSAPRTPQQNRVVERKNRTLVYITRTMMVDSGLAMTFG
ncbi:uncharacterized protein LOC125828888 [Solanum verrucosum]|uniref:uncharacterized protein LOC125828888 n=1 Tax=Solanum verrucosum TaxID=315347 RepID=UPI0020D090D4|nr:uncharacterized protein LOC125828888 [Solanum verrucosum]